ncbi:MAG: YaaL family protein [Firmicutes bacterium]|nr:YaaL family protein [Bacillota bacterium]
MPNILSTFLSAEEDYGEVEQLLENIESARQDWQNARNFFDEVTDPDLVDMAIYSMDAAEKRYVYLLKLAKVRGIKLPGYPEIHTS